MIETCICGYIHDARFGCGSGIKIEQISDTNRLEWMCKNGEICYLNAGEWTTSRSLKYFKTPREAIDAAMKDNGGK
jgi:hypothetical protein